MSCKKPLKHFSLFPVLALCLLLTACGEKLTPLDVSQRFWKAVELGDVQAIRHFTAKGSINEDDISEHLLPVRNARFGRIVIDGAEASVDTEVEVVSDKPLQVPLHTLLIQQEGEWRVDYNSTIAAIRTESSLAGLLDRLRIFSHQIQGDMEQSIEKFEEKVPEIQQKMDEVEDMLKEKIPEIREQVEAIMKELEDALRRDEPKPQGDNQKAI